MEIMLTVLILSFCWTILLEILEEEDRDIFNINKYLINDCKKFHNRWWFK